MTAFFNATSELSEDECAFYNAENLEEIFSDPLFRYVIVNIEVCPGTGRTHWQMYLELSRPCRYTAIRDRVPLLCEAHFEARMGTADEAVAYCQKVETRHPDATGFYEYGVRAPGQGYRSDMESLTEMLESGATPRDVAEQMPGMFLRHHRGIEAYIDVMRQKPSVEDGFVPRVWQSEVIEVVSGEADDRSILWVTDVQGGHGKTRLATHLIRNFGAVQLSGRMADMKYGYMMNQAPIVVIDITRASAECVKHLYSIAEELKSGRLFNTKYRCVNFFFTPPHVVMFSNTTWDRTLFSEDRVREWML